jgi:hypothetical protein
MILILKSGRVVVPPILTMSLKGFHILFIVVSILLSLGVGGEGLRGYFSSGEKSGLVMGLISLSVMVGLIAYALNFFRKLRKL